MRGKQIEAPPASNGVNNGDGVSPSPGLGERRKFPRRVQGRNEFGAFLASKKFSHGGTMTVP